MVTEKIAKDNHLNPQPIELKKYDVPIDPDAEEISFLLDCDVYRANDCGFQGLTYVAGFIASKFKDKYPALGKKN